MDLEKRVKMRFAMQRHILSHDLKPKKNSMDSFARDIDAELRRGHPPTTKAIVTLYMMLDTEFMVNLLKRNRDFRGPMTLVIISRDPFHPMHSRIKRAFEFAQERRTLAGFPRDPWPMTFANVNRDHRRLVWEPVIWEIKEAWVLENHDFS